MEKLRADQMAAYRMVTTGEPLLYALHRARKPDTAFVLALQIPVAVALVTAVAYAACCPTGIIDAATQLVPSTVASNVTVAESVPVICTDTAPGDGKPSTVAACSAALMVT